MAKRPLELPVVLGTSSKWRRQLFSKHFPSYGSDCMAAYIDEKAIRMDDPEDMTIAIAAGKADELVPKLANKEVLLLCLDQVVSCDDEVREKPVDEKEARKFLGSYKVGRGARCVNGMVVHNTKTGRRVSASESSTAYFKTFPDSVIDDLIQDGEVLGSAGGFCVDHKYLAPYVDSIEGTTDSIEGLPVEAVRCLLERAVAPAVTHVIFDMDGLLIDTEDAYTVAQQKILDRWDKKFTWELKAKMMGKKALDACQELVKDLGLEGEVTAEEFLAERESLLDQLFADSNLLPGVDQLIRHLHKHGVPMAVATSSHKRHFDLKTSKHKDFFGLMHHIITGDMVKHSKPDPEIFKLAAERFDTVPGAANILVFEDAPVGVEAAAKAGMQSCMVPHASLPKGLRRGADDVIASMAKFKPQEWGLPPF